jgi:hypothetical protein
VVNGDFTQLFDDCHIENIITTTFDHFAIYISLKKHSDNVPCQPVKRGFKFEVAWLRSPDYVKVLERAWNDNSDGINSLQSVNLVERCVPSWAIGCVLYRQGRTPCVAIQEVYIYGRCTTPYTVYIRYYILQHPPLI